MKLSLFVEGLRMRPTAERVLVSLSAMDGQPAFYPVGNTIAELAGHSGLTAHVVRARLCDLRRLGLVESDRFGRNARYTHCLTDEGLRRASVVPALANDAIPI